MLVEGECPQPGNADGVEITQQRATVGESLEDGYMKPKRSFGERRDIEDFDALGVALESIPDVLADEAIRVLVYRLVRQMNRVLVGGVSVRSIVTSARLT